MKTLLKSETNVPWLEVDAIVETYISDELPPMIEYTSAYAIVFNDNGKLLQTDLRKGERPERQLDIPGGHIDGKETSEQTAIRETFEETGVIIKSLQLVAHVKITIISPKPDNYRYPYPVSYMLFYRSEAFEETEFNGNDEVHGRVWLSECEFEKSDWCNNNKELLAAIMEDDL